MGSGPGTDAAPFVDAGLAYAGFDVAVGNARLAHATGLAIVPGSLFDAPFRPHAFDAGWTMSTLLQLPDDRFDEAVAATTSLLRPGAPLAIGLWGGRDREFVNDTDHFDPPRFFSHRSDDRAQAMLSASRHPRVVRGMVNRRGRLELSVHRSAGVTRARGFRGAE